MALILNKRRRLLSAGAAYITVNTPSHAAAAFIYYAVAFAINRVYYRFTVIYTVAAAAIIIFKYGRFTFITTGNIRRPRVAFLL